MSFLMQIAPSVGRELEQVYSVLMVAHQNLFLSEHKPKVSVDTTLKLSIESRYKTLEFFGQIE